MTAVIYNHLGDVFELCVSGGHHGSPWPPLRDLVERHQSMDTVDFDADRRDGVIDVLTDAGTHNAASIRTASHAELRAMVSSSLRNGMLTLVPYESRIDFRTMLVFNPDPVSLEVEDSDVPALRATHTLELQLVDPDGQPMAGECYRVELPDGTVIEGNLNAQGCALLTGIEDPGDCEIDFPGWNADDWDHTQPALAHAG